MDTPGFITPPPNLIPPRWDQDNEQRRVPERKRELPPFIPSGAQGAKSPAPKAPQTTPTPAMQSWSLVFSDGTVVPVTEALLVGRDPVNRAPWNTAQLVKVSDPTKSVSKTHAVFELTRKGVTVTDLKSTNGVFLFTTGDDGDLIESGAPTPLFNGSTLELGRFSVHVSLK